MAQISIRIPTYNMAKFVGVAVESALSQTYTDVEVIVYDNASTDNTQEVLAQFDDPRLSVFPPLRSQPRYRAFPKNYASSLVRES